MVERLLIAIILVGLGVAAHYGFQQQTLRRARRQGQVDPLLTAFTPGNPAIVYFTSESCGACKLQQEPVLAQLQKIGSFNALQIIEVDADLQRYDAERWGVMSLPTTFILDREGKPAAVNYGVASVQKLRQQLETLH